MKVEKQLTHPKRHQVIFELLGSQFVDRYFPEMENDPNVLVRVTKHPLCTDNTSTVTSTDNTSTVTSTDNTPTVTSTDNPFTVTSTDNRSTVTSTDNTSTVTSTDNTSTFFCDINILTFQEPPHTAVDERRKLFTDAQNWLSNTIAKVTTETACQRPKQVGLVQSVTPVLFKIHKTSTDTLISPRVT